MSNEYNTYAVLGLQWGDEGKGKIISRLSTDADYIVRYQGSNNAGHSLVLNDKKIKLNMLPIGIINTKGKCILSAGTSIDIDTLIEEIEILEKNSILVDNLYIDGRAHLIMPYHVLLDSVKFENSNKAFKKSDKLGSISCSYDKFIKKGIRVFDLLDLERFSNKLLENTKRYNDELKKCSEEEIDFEYIYSKYEDFAKNIKAVIIDSMVTLNNEIDKGKKVVFEGSTSSMLDINFGTYPDVISESAMASSISTGSGVANSKIKNVIGVFKAYSTRVLEGVFPTEIFGQELNTLRNNGNEYISSTGAARRCGWLDLSILKYTSLINGVTELNMTKLDALSGIEKIKLAIAYEIDGRVYPVYPMNLDETTDINVLYKEFDGWNEDISQITEYEDLPSNCKRYIEYIEGYLEKKIKIISVGPRKEQTIIR